MVINKGRLGQVYNIGGHNEKQNIEIVNIIIDTLNQILDENDVRKKYINDKLIKYVKDRKGHDRRYAIDPSKIKDEIGWYPETCFEKGIKHTIKWYLENEEWLKNITNGEYLKYYSEMYE